MGVFEDSPDRGGERKLHKKMAASRIRGEWFTPTTEVLSYLALATDTKQHIKELRQQLVSRRKQEKLLKIALEPFSYEERAEIMNVLSRNGADLDERLHKLVKGNTKSLSVFLNQIRR